MKKFKLPTVPAIVAICLLAVVFISCQKQEKTIKFFKMTRFENQCIILHAPDSDTVKNIYDKKYIEIRGDTLSLIGVLFKDINEQSKKYYLASDILNYITTDGVVTNKDSFDIAVIRYKAFLNKSNDYDVKK